MPELTDSQLLKIVEDTIDHAIKDKDAAKALLFKILREHPTILEDSIN